MKACFLHELGDCCDQISREHYVSAAVLKAVAPNKDLRVGGLAWQKPMVIQGIGAASLQAKILCRKHNSLLSSLDSEAGRFSDTVISTDNESQPFESEATFDGSMIERWMLKTLLSTSAADGLTSGSVPENYKLVLVGGEWPEGSGMYAASSLQPQQFSRDLLIDTYINPENNEISAALFRVAGVSLWLVIGKPDHPDSFGVYRPQGLIFEKKNMIKRVRFDWTGSHSDKAVIYTCIGVTNSPAPHMQGWENI